MPGLQVAAIDEDGSLRLMPRQGAPAAVDRRIPVEAAYPDADGATVHVLLHVVDGRLHELEIYRDPGGPVTIPAPEAPQLDLDPWSAKG